MTTNENAMLTDEQLKAAERIQKILDRAANNPNEHERATAMALAQEQLAKYNLDQGTVEAAVGGSGKRQQQLVEGGFFKWHRDLWWAVAQLNFCLYWSQSYTTDEKVRQTHRVRGEYVGVRMVHARRRRHALIGRTVNVRMTQVMASYLIQSIERVTRDRLADNADNLVSAWAYSFRQGAAEDVIARLRDRRFEMIEEEAAKLKRAQERADAEGGTTSTALTLASFTKAEEDANADFLHGEGYSARRQEAQEKAAARSRAMREAYTKWAADNPKAAMSKFEFTDEEGETWRYTNRPIGGGRRSDRSSVKDRSAYRQGREAGATIGLDPQTGNSKNNQGRIAGPKTMHL